MAYLLDADVFIRAKNLHYGLDFCPAFWEWLVGENAAERLFSIEKVAMRFRRWRMSCRHGRRSEMAVSSFGRTPMSFPRWRRSAPRPEVNATSPPP
jgi:hypothetical protein